MSALTSAFSETLIASIGHADAHVAQPVHVGLSTFTAIMVLPRCTLDAGFHIYPLPSLDDFILVYTAVYSRSPDVRSGQNTGTHIRAQHQK